MVIEIREKGQSKDFLLGISTASLHPFYLAFRNSTLVKYLSEKQVSWLLTLLFKILLINLGDFSFLQLQLMVGNTL